MQWQWSTQSLRCTAILIQGVEIGVELWAFDIDFN